MNARRSDSLAARLNAISRMCDGRIAAFLNEMTMFVEIGSIVSARDDIERARDDLNNALGLIEAELAEAERGKPKPARKQKRSVAR